MTRDELYRKMANLVPVSRKDDRDFRETLSLALKDYQSCLANLDIAERIHPWEDLLTKVENICSTLKSIVTSQYKGLHSTSFKQLSNLMAGTKKNVGLFDKMPFHQLPINEPLFRMRTFDRKKGVTYKDMFHIPLTLRGTVKTQRYSMSGYPCLYLGKSIYGCWEEMERPVMSSCMVSCLKNTEPLRLLDLRVPTKESWDHDMENALLIFPLFIACMIPVKNHDDVYKPEYIIPQLLIEWIIKLNSNKKNQTIHGIYYTSAFKNYEFHFPDEKLNNIAIPILNPLGSNKYCSRLSSLFKITNPTCNEYEQLKCGYGIDGGHIGLSEEEQLQENYETSDFGYLEKRLLNSREFPLNSMS